MNVFFVGWNMRSPQATRVLEELTALTRIYPNLDPTTLWRTYPDPNVFAAGLHSVQELVSPRQYVYRTFRGVTFYTGTPIATLGSIQPHRADSLDANWDLVTDQLDGQFAAIRLRVKSAALELVTDPLGFEQVYYVRRGDAWLISNSVHLLCRLSDGPSLDPTAVAQFLNLGSCVGNRTLRQGVRVFEGGMRFRWDLDRAEPVLTPTVDRAQLSRRRHRLFNRRDARQLADDMEQMCRYLMETFGPLSCPITGGKDSRVLLSLLLHGRIPPQQLYTAGQATSVDRLIAAEVARSLDLDLQVIPVDTADLVVNWEQSCRTMVAQTDGLVSLAQVGDIPHGREPVKRRELGLWGFGGEIARPNYLGAPRALRTLTEHDMLRSLPHFIANRPGALVRRNGYDQTRESIRDVLQERLSEGMHVSDLPQAFFAFDHVRRWGGSNLRKLVARADLFSPFCTRRFLEAAFTVPRLSRHTEPIHYQLLNLLSPELLRIPFDKPLRTRSTSLQVVQEAHSRLASRLTAIRAGNGRNGTNGRNGSNGTAASQAVYNLPKLVEAKRDRIREICLSRRNSVVWEFVDAASLEWLCSDAAGPDDRAGCARSLLNIATLFYYEDSGNGSSPAPVRLPAGLNGLIQRAPALECRERAPAMAAV